MIKGFTAIPIQKDCVSFHVSKVLKIMPTNQVSENVETRQKNLLAIHNETTGKSGLF